jgi:hypothetical protein
MKNLEQINYCHFHKQDYIIDYGNDYGQFYDTETQTHVMSEKDIENINKEYDYYIDNYNMTLTHEENMLEYVQKDYLYPSTFTTIGVIILIMKSISSFIFN